MVFNNDSNIAVAKAGGTKAVISAMHNHTSRAGLQHYGCWAMANIAIISNNKGTVVKSGSTEAVITTMHN